MCDKLSFLSEGDFKVLISELFRMVSLLGRKFIILGQPNFNSFETFLYTHVVLLINFQEQFELYFCFKY